MRQLASSLGEPIVVVQVNVDECPQLVADYVVQAVPTILLLREGRIVHGQCDELTESELRCLVEEHLLVK